MMFRYGKWDDVINNQYPGHEEIAYPKVGMTNPLVTLTVVQLSSGQKLQIRPPDSIARFWTSL